MTGSIIAFIPELPEDKSGLFERIVDNEEFEKIELEYLTSLDFTIINNLAGTNWESENNPVVYDEEGGLVIVHLDKAGVQSVISFEGELDSVDRETQDADIAAIRAFAQKHGYNNLYEVVTF
ncbi:hypothetical protein [uncultured Flavobacterium sp.]|uniref:hypothetical protein n=1 Tax=uncultured Flavobacterium sp. TaxID=165435 RepID=UPI0025F50DE1|nr:hypothetical protein [uncultured Flavobacterium sp.]